jgi:hypothetical protein
LHGFCKCSHIMNMLRFPKRRAPWLTACCLFLNSLSEPGMGEVCSQATVGSLRCCTFRDYHTPLALFFKGKGCRARAPGNLLWVDL